MKKQMVAGILLILLLIATCTQGDQMKANNQAQAQAQVDILSAKLANSEIGRVEIYQIPPEVLTRIRITPGVLEKQAHYKLTLHDVRGGAYKDELIEAIKSITVQSQSEMVDIRWGVIFYSLDDDSRIGALYFNKTGSRGAVGETPVSFNGNFFKWLERNFSHCFR